MKGVCKKWLIFAQHSIAKLTEMLSDVTYHLAVKQFRLQQNLTLQIAAFLSHCHDQSEQNNHKTLGGRGKMRRDIFYGYSQILWSTFGKSLVGKFYVQGKAESIAVTNYLKPYDSKKWQKTSQSNSGKKWLEKSKNSDFRCRKSRVASQRGVKFRGNGLVSVW